MISILKYRRKNDKKKFIYSFLALSAIASSLTVGNTLPTLKIKDQFEKEHVVDANIKTIIFFSYKI